jgi:glycosyltransferase involved in cell wall biosynthesis
VISYIFTYRQSTDDRYKNLLTVLQWLNNINIPKLEVVIVEQDEISKLNILKTYNFPIRHIFAYNNKLFNRSWGFNVAVKNTTNPILFFADSDMIIQPDQLKYCINLLHQNQFDSISPFTHCYDISIEETGNIDLINFDYTKDRVIRGGMNFCSGIVAFNRTSFERIRAWDERFEGWGGEDDIQFLKTRQLLRYSILNTKCFHLYHQRSKNDGTNQHENYANNLNLFWHYQRQPLKILTDMNIQENWGDLKKYQK